MMRAAIRTRYGTPDVVEVVDVDRPEPTGDQLLVRVRVASVNRADLDGIQPRPAFTRLFLGLRSPRNPRIGIDMAGVVEAVGPSVTRFQPGDAVFGDLFSFGQGAFAEFVCVPERAVEPVPDGVSLEDAATLPHSAILALQGLRRRNGRTVQPGDRVLVDGASGNVGPFAVQIAKARGAHVTGVCRTEKVEFVRSLGADEVLDYTAVDYTRTGETWDWILDTDSHHSVRRCRRALRPNGTYVTLGGTGWPILSALIVGPLLSLRGGRYSGLMLWWKPFDRTDAATLTRMVADGTIRPAIDRRFPLIDTADALRHVDDGLAKGKVLVTVP
jgi:NADPH:quinone reductase-like Zn-dependent oxidoreductase